jgi:hypothetical protein
LDYSKFPDDTVPQATVPHILLFLCPRIRIRYYYSTRHNNVKHYLSAGHFPPFLFCWLPYYKTGQVPCRAAENPQKSRVANRTVPFLAVRLPRSPLPSFLAATDRSHLPYRHGRCAGPRLPPPIRRGAARVPPRLLRLLRFPRGQCVRPRSEGFHLGGRADRRVGARDLDAGLEATASGGLRSGGRRRRRRSRRR